MTTDGGREDASSQTAVMAGLAVETRKLTNATEKLLKQAALTKIERALFAAAAFVMVVLLVFVAVLGVVTIRELTSAQASRAQLTDCIDPGDPTAHPPRPAGKCYQRGQAQTGAAITQLTQNNAAYLLISLLCADESTDTAKASCFHAKARLAGLEK